MRRTAIANPFHGFGQQRLDEIIKRVIGSDGPLFVVARRATHRYVARQFDGGREVGAFKVRRPAEGLSHGRVEFVAHNFVVDDVDAREIPGSSERTLSRSRGGVRRRLRRSRPSR